MVCFVGKYYCLIGNYFLNGPEKKLSLNTVKLDTNRTVIANSLYEVAFSVLAF